MSGIIYNLLRIFFTTTSENRAQMVWIGLGILICYLYYRHEKNKHAVKIKYEYLDKLTNLQKSTLLLKGINDPYTLMDVSMIESQLTFFEQLLLRAPSTSEMRVLKSELDALEMFIDLCLFEQRQNEAYSNIVVFRQRKSK
jgi:hypothetical protein